MADNNEGVIIRVGLDGVNVTSSLTSLRNTVRASMNQMRAEFSVFDTAGERINALNARYTGIQRTIQAQDVLLERLTQNYRLAAAQYGENSTQALRYANQINNVVRQQEGLRAQLSQVNSQLRTARSEMSLLGRSSTVFNNISSRADAAAKKLKDFGKTMSMSVTLPVAGALAESAKTYIEFNQQLTQMKSLLNDGSVDAATLNKEIKTLGSNTQKWAQSYGESTKDINDGEEELIKKGYTYNQVIGAMPSLLNAARASGDDFTTVMSISTSALEQFNLKASDTATMTKNTQRVTDSLSYVANKTAAGFNDLGVALTYVGPVAHSVGYSLEDTASALGLLANNGIESDKAGTALRGAISRMLKPTKQSAAAFEEMGLSTDKMKKGFYSLPDLLDTINKNTQGMTKAEKAHLITQAFGVQAQTGMNILLQQGGDALRKLSDQTQKATGYTKKLSDQMGNSAQVQVNKLKSSVQVLGQEIGQELVPELIPLVDKTSNLIKEFGSLSDQQKHLIIDTGLFAAAIGPVGLILGGTATTVKVVSGTLGSLTGILSRVGVAGAEAAGEAGALTGALGLLTGPVGITIAALGALGFAGYEVYKHINDANSSMYKLQKVSLDAAKSTEKQYDSNNNMIDSLDSLRAKSRLTNDQFAEYMDLQSKIKKSTDPKVISDLKDKMNDLQNKSGLSNKELQTMVSLNNTLVKKLPTATSKITDQGNRVAGATDELKKYNAELAKTATRQLMTDYLKAQENQNTLSKQKNDLQDKFNNGLKTERSLTDILQNYSKKNLDNLLAQYSSQEQSLELKRALYVVEGKSTKSLDDQISRYKTILKGLDGGKKGLTDQLVTQRQQDDSLKKQITHVNQQQQKYKDLQKQLQENLLVNAGINKSVAERNAKEGTSKSLIISQIASLEDEKKHNKDLLNQHKITVSQYESMNSQVDKQISKLNGVISKLKDIDNQAKKPVTKRVTVTVDTSKMSTKEKQLVMGQVRAYEVQAKALQGYATGTDYVPQTGSYLVGEKGPEIVTLPQGASVMNNDQTMAMLNTNLTSNSKVIQMMNRASRQTPSSGSVDTSRLEQLQDSNNQLQAKNNQLVSMLIQALNNKEFSITTKQIYDANKSYSDQQTKSVNLAKGVLTAG
ncbi:phage tail tape measure protein [Pullulanibacillus sp. KACC 23026]|uniref:phage tail tape measure protein n=1 Tax=Pullulanibacillus sp. KACC 23026 TaxID=3028315 RepID=UPI0023B12EB5|nr:phage tail tape measure protein [Pullulanibacillus sp. KACC 23026]WEG14157.1 phage tail tape measure protein [Pullulanibacillus sp. KACC 23026]